VAYVLAAMAAFVNALTSVLQRIGVETAPESTTLRLSLMAHAVRRGIWLIGFGLMLVVFGLQATALRFGELSVVQPVLTTELLFLLLILGAWFRFRLTWQEWLGAVTVVVGLGGFFLVAAPSGGQAIPDTKQWVVASVVLIGIIAGCIAAALRGPRWWRAAAFGAAAAVTGGYTAALTKAITNYTKLGWGHVFTHFQPYMLGIAGLGTVFLLQNALHAGPITASRTTLVTINPLVSIVLGTLLFADRLRAGSGWIALEVVALLVLGVGVVMLARSPLVAGEHHAGDPGEMLGDARRRALDEPEPVLEGVGIEPPPVEPLPSAGSGSST
jgi:drug/metabolite transporter (DMT)-like permease